MFPASKLSWDVPVKKDVQICVVGKVFKPNREKVLALNTTLVEYFKLVKWYLTFNSKSKMFLHKNGYEVAKGLFSLNTALIQTARDKAVEVLKSFEKNRNEDSILRLKRISVRDEEHSKDMSQMRVCYPSEREKLRMSKLWNGV